jgi:hypothetical protein
MRENVGRDIRLHECAGSDAMEVALDLVPRRWSVPRSYTAVVQSQACRASSSFSASVVYRRAICRHASKLCSCAYTFPLSASCPRTRKNTAVNWDNVLRTEGAPVGLVGATLALSLVSHHVETEVPCPRRGQWLRKGLRRQRWTCRGEGVRFRKGSSWRRVGVRW